MRATGKVIAVAIVFALLLGAGALAQRVAVLVQCAIGVPPEAIQQLRSYAAQRVSVYSGMEVIPDYRVRRAEAAVGVYLGTYIPDDGVRKIIDYLGADYLFIIRIIKWEDTWEVRAERALFLSGVGLLDPTLGNLLGPLGLLSALDRRAKVTLLARLYDRQGLVYANVVSADDAPFFSWLFSDPVRAAKRAVDMALSEVFQMI